MFSLKHKWQTRMFIHQFHYHRDASSGHILEDGTTVDDDNLRTEFSYLLVKKRANFHFHHFPEEISKLFPIALPMIRKPVELTNAVARPSAINYAAVLENNAIK